MFIPSVAMATRLQEQAEAFKAKEQEANQLLMERDNVGSVFVFVWCVHIKDIAVSIKCIAHFYYRN